MSVVVDPGSPSSSGAVIKKHIVVGCILLMKSFSWLGFPSLGVASLP